MIDASPAGTGPNNIHDYVLEDDMSAIMSTEELFEEQDEIMDMAADSNVMIFSPLENALQDWRHPDTNPSHDSKSACTRPTVDTNDSLDCTNDDKVIFLYFQCYLNLFLISNKNWKPVWMRCLDSIQITALW
jgi:hypothetical protein